METNCAEIGWVWVIGRHTAMLFTAEPAICLCKKYKKSAQSGVRRLAAN